MDTSLDHRQATGFGKRLGELAASASLAPAAQPAPTHRFGPLIDRIIAGIGKRRQASEDAMGKLRANLFLREG